MFIVNVKAGAGSLPVGVRRNFGDCSRHGDQLCKAVDQVHAHERILHGEEV